MTGRVRFRVVPGEPSRVIEVTADGITYRATYYPPGGPGTPGYWTVRTSDREAAEPHYDNDWYEANERNVRAAIAHTITRARTTGDH